MLLSFFDSFLRLPFFFGEPFETGAAFLGLALYS